MTWKTLFQLFYVSLLAFGIWLARAKADPLVNEPPPPVALSSESQMAVVAVMSSPPASAEDIKVIEREPASTQKLCPELSETGGQYKIRQTKFADGSCHISVTETGAAPRRTIEWNSLGRMEVSVDTKLETKEKTSLPNDFPGGSRTYFIAPAGGPLSIDGLHQQGLDYEIKTSAELIWTFEKINREPRLPSECKGQIVPATKSNQAGLLLETCRERLIVDLGWKTAGSEEVFSAEALATLKDPEGHSCQVKMAKVLSPPTTAANLQPRFQSGQEWLDFVKTEPTCAILNLEFMKARTHSGAVEKKEPVALAPEYAP